ncbi:MAG: bifunctional salicylyl-CoA 5-hydroxylase/oxidoreductase [Methylobacteriaceae bacterium]|nr:bifunctional salicylyl-CoA 5-hydroxylase/oxidoreductase [Methylobacteriaceae bacterium]
MAREKPLRIAIVGGGPGGLYFSILMKKARPEADITVYERNQADDTYGFGVVFSDETLSNFEARDPESYAAITNEFVYWGEIDTIAKGETIRSNGHGFCGMERRTLLLVLQERARGLGVRLIYGVEIDDLAQLGQPDVIVAADGINSAIRARYAEHFRPQIDWRHNKFCWLGSTKPLPAFTFAFRENQHGIWILGAYQYKPGRSTWVPECDEATWRRAGLDQASEAETVAYLEELYADLLDGHRLLTNRSIWRNFPMVKNERWFFRNIVLLGDALHTAHYSIGSGTKLAMEDAIALADAMLAHDAVLDALAHFEEVRREEVEKTQHAADVSLVWFEKPRRFWKLEPMQLTVSLLSRSKQITYENLRRRDTAFVREVDGWWAGKVGREQGFAIPADDPPPPMFTPFRLCDLVLPNRVVVSPMNMYSAEEGGIPGDFHLVHLGRLAMGGAGLVFAEMTSVSESGRITPGCPGIYTDGQEAAWRRICDFVHRHSEAKICLQLGHAGRKGSTRRGWDGMDLPMPDGENWPIVSASPLPFRAESQAPTELSRAGMDAVRDDFAAAARRAKSAGFDMLELHMAHGYLLSSFISPLTNRREDAYGGSLENRMRFPLEVFDAVRAVWAHAPLSVRISATDWVPGRGLEVEDAIEIARLLKAHGVDILDISAGQTTIEARPVYGRMFQVPFSEAIRSEVDIPTIAVGNVTTADQVNTIVVSGRADLVALARPHLLDPHFTLRASAHYGYAGQAWPKPYLAGKEQALRLFERSNAEEAQLRLAARPKPSTGRLAAE